MSLAPYRALSATMDQPVTLGYFQLTVAPPIPVATVDATKVRGVPTKISGISFSDPFGPKSLALTFPAVTMFDKLGLGDLYWLVKHADVRLTWTGPGVSWRPSPITTTWSWEGYIASFSWSNQGLAVQCKGALYQLDNYLAKPEYTTRPLPYEWAIQRQFITRPSLRVPPLRVVWPTWWTKRYDPAVIKGVTGGVPLAYQIPLGVSKGDLWTELLTRSTGTFDPVLTSYITSLLTVMYTERGRWTLDLDRGRVPYLYHQDTLNEPDLTTVVIDPAAPGVEVNLAEDWEQSLTDVYMQGLSADGISYTGMAISPDGNSTTYVPASAQRQTYPTLPSNPWFDKLVMPKEVHIQAQTGLSADDAAVVASYHRQRFAEPGITGTVDLTSDPMVNGQVVSRYLVRAGMNLTLPRLLGSAAGVTARIVDSSADLEAGKVSLTIDTKNRDALTVNEVRMRGRDALSVTRSVIAGHYTPPVPDLMYPWSYAANSGYVPGGPTYSSKRLFDGMPAGLAFPYESWTKAHPPSSPRYRNGYIRIGPASQVADDNWSTMATGTATRVGYPVKMAAAGSIRLLQIAAYDRNGAVLPIPFHFSLWYVTGTNVKSMPAIPVEQVKLFPPYKAGQRYPFWRDAWEKTLISGAIAGKNDARAWEANGEVRMYGDFYNKAGYYPGSYAEGDAPTGLLVDETQWAFNLAESPNSQANWNPYDPEKNKSNPLAGFVYAFFYADAQDVSEVYFAGRMFRVEPGTGSAASQT